MGINLNTTDGWDEMDDVGHVTPHQQSRFPRNLACLFHHISAASLQKWSPVLQPRRPTSTDNVSKVQSLWTLQTTLACILQWSHETITKWRRKALTPILCTTTNAGTSTNYNTTCRTLSKQDHHISTMSRCNSCPVCAFPRSTSNHNSKDVY